MSMLFLQNHFRNNGKIKLISFTYSSNTIYFRRHIHNFFTGTISYNKQKGKSYYSSDGINQRCFSVFNFLKKRGGNEEFEEREVKGVEIEIEEKKKEGNEKFEEREVKGVEIEVGEKTRKVEDVSIGVEKEVNDVMITENTIETDNISNIPSYVYFLIEKCQENIKNEVDEYEESWYVKLIYELLKTTKLIFDCSWTSSIIITTVLVRMIILPLTVSAERDKRKQAILNPLIRDLTEKLKTNAQEGNIKKAIEYKNKILNVRNSHGISLIPKSIILMTFFQTPLFCMFYFSMKKISSFPHIFKEFTFESPLWLDSLSLPDPYCIMPFLSSLLLLSNHELTTLLEKQMKTQRGYFEETEFQKNVKKITRIGMRLFYISSFFFFKSMPAGLFIYFITNTFFQLFVTQICKIKMMERFLDLPSLHSKGFTYSDKQEKESTGKRKKIIHMEELMNKRR